MSLRITLLLIVLSIGAFAREPQAPASTIRQVAKYMRKHVALEKRQAAATAVASRREQTAQRRRYALSQCDDAEHAAQLRQRVQSLQEGYDRTASELATAKIKDPAARAAKLHEMLMQVVTASDAGDASNTTFRGEFEALVKEQELTMREFAATPGKEDMKRRSANPIAKRKDLRSRARTASRIPNALKREAMQNARELHIPYGPGRAAALGSRLESQERDLLGARAELATAVITDPKERRQEREKAVAAAQKDRQAAREAGLSLIAEEIALRRERRDGQLALLKMMDGVRRMPKGLGIVEAGVITCPRDASVLPWWSDARDKKLVRAHLRFRPVPKLTDPQHRVTGRFPVQSWTFKSIRFWVGGVDIDLQVEREEWRNKAKVMELATKLIDLDTIGTWTKIENAQ